MLLLRRPVCALALLFSLGVCLFLSVHFFLTTPSEGDAPKGEGTERSKLGGGGNPTHIGSLSRGLIHLRPLQVAFCDAATKRIGMKGRERETERSLLIESLKYR